MNRKFISAVLFIMLAIGGALYTQALAQPRFQEGPTTADGQGQVGPQHRLELMAEVLDLTDDQQAQIKEIFDSEREAMGPYLEQLKQGREAINEAVCNPTFDEVQVRALATRQAEIKVELTVAKARAKNKIFVLLTPEQQEKAKKLRHLLEGHGKRGHHRGF